MHAMLDQPSIPTRDTETPYTFEHNQCFADVTLRTSDSIDFHVHTQILSKVSPFFATMFTLPQHGEMPESLRERPEGPLDRPVIDVAEDSKVLEPLLRFCYSMQETGLQHLEGVLPVLAAAIKYDMEQPIMDALTARLLECAAQGPLQLWAFGCRHRLERVARGGAEALRASLPARARKTLSFLPDISPDMQGLNGISAGQYFRLLQFVSRRDCSAAAHRGCSPNAAETGGTDRIALVGPAETATARVATSAPCRRRALDLLGHAPMDVRPPDIVCRCQDGAEFEAHQHILSLHSPVLKAQIATLNAAPEGPRPPQREEFAEQVEEPAAALPVLQLEGPSHATSILLRMCYELHHRPRASEPPRSRLDCIELLAVATKYRIQPAIDLATTRWEALAHIHPRNSGMCRATWTVAAAATPAALGWCPPQSARLADFSRILEELPARTYHELFVYLDACARAVVQALEKATAAWERTAAERAGAEACPAAPMCLYQAVTDALNRRRKEVERREVAPKADVVRAIRWSSYRDAPGSPSLRRTFKADLDSLLASLPQEINDALSTVQLDLG